MSREDFDGGYSEWAKEQHKKRVADNPNRIQYAIEQFEKHNIEYVLKNETTGHFHCRRKCDDKLFQFYAGTGKIMVTKNRVAGKLLTGDNAIKVYYSGKSKRIQMSPYENKEYSCFKPTQEELLNEAIQDLPF